MIIYNKRTLKRMMIIIWIDLSLDPGHLRPTPKTGLVFRIIMKIMIICVVKRLMLQLCLHHETIRSRWFCNCICHPIIKRVKDILV